MPFFRNRAKLKTAVFFDIDGVLNTVSQWKEERFALKAPLIENLALFTKRTGCDLVLASSWRAGFVAPNSEKNLPHIRRLEDALAKHGVPIVGATPILHGHPREDEVAAYLRRHSYDAFAIVDDDPEEYAAIPSQAVFTNPTEGFTKEKAAELSRVLKTPPNTKSTACDCELLIEDCMTLIPDITKSANYVVDPIDESEFILR